MVRGDSDTQNSLVSPQSSVQHLHISLTFAVLCHTTGAGGKNDQIKEQINGKRKKIFKLT